MDGGPQTDWEGCHDGENPSEENQHKGNRFTRPSRWVGWCRHCCDRSGRSEGVATRRRRENRSFRACSKHPTAFATCAVISKQKSRSMCRLSPFENGEHNSA